MSEPARLWKTPPGVDLGPLSQIADGRARNFVLQMKAGRFHGFAVRCGQAVHGYVDRCPHAGLPLAQELDGYMTTSGEHIACSWHGALFDPVTGVCVGGPCAGAALTPWPLSVAADRIITA